MRDRTCDTVALAGFAPWSQVVKNLPLVLSLSALE